jgi:hypothetical protein
MHNNNSRRKEAQCTIMKYETIGEFKPSDEFIILCIAWENTKTSFLCSIKLVDKLTISFILEWKIVKT